jgi:hypothetical protein
MPFERSIFVNCPFDEDFAPLLQAMLFCIIYLGYEPRLANERDNAAENRLSKIVELVESSKYSIHDLSRCQARQANEHFRLNMPFELGIDYGARTFGEGQLRHKKMLVLEEKPYRYQAAISDIAGSDIQFHGGSYDKAIRKVRNWLVTEASAQAAGPAFIVGQYTSFQEWHLETQLANGFSDEDIQDYPTVELLNAMLQWKALGEPASG